MSRAAHPGLDPLPGPDMMVPGGAYPPALPGREAEIASRTGLVVVSGTSMIEVGHGRTGSSGAPWMTSLRTGVAAGLPALLESSA